jgi:hypothetical protein
VFKFHKKGISVGETVTCSIDSSVTAVVVDDSHIDLGGRRMTLSGATLEILKQQGITRNSVQGTKYWLFKGTRISDLTEAELSPTQHGGQR